MFFNVCHPRFVNTNTSIKQSSVQNKLLWRFKKATFSVVENNHHQVSYFRRT